MAERLNSWKQSLVTKTGNFKSLFFFVLSIFTKTKTWRSFELCSIIMEWIIFTSICNSFKVCQMFAYISTNWCLIEPFVFYNCLPFGRYSSLWRQILFMEDIFHLTWTNYISICKCKTDTKIIRMIMKYRKFCMGSFNKCFKFLLVFFQQNLFRICFSSFRK